MWGKKKQDEMNQSPEPAPDMAGDKEKQGRPQETPASPAEAKGEPPKKEAVALSPAECEELKKKAAEAAEYKDKYLRLCAEFDNARKRYEREKMEFVKYANEAVIGDFLGILDDFERIIEAANSHNESPEAFLKGVKMVMAHVYDFLRKNNVRPIEALGKKFDPHCHEVLLQEESREHEDGAVIEELQKGYLYGDRVLRTAKVKVAKKSSC